MPNAVKSYIKIRLFEVFILENGETMNRKMVTIDGNAAAAYVAHATNEVIAIYP